MATVTISLPESLKQFVEAQLAEKGFGNVSEYFRSLVREAQAKEESARLERLLLEGLASGEGMPVTKAFWADVKKEAAQLMQAHRARKKPV